MLIKSKFVGEFWREEFEPKRGLYNLGSVCMGNREFVFEAKEMMPDSDNYTYSLPSTEEKELYKKIKKEKEDADLLERQQSENC